MSGFAASKFSISCSIAVTRASKKYCQYSISTALAAPPKSAATLVAVASAVAFIILNPMDCLPVMAPSGRHAVGRSARSTPRGQELAQVT
jgi:tetrahydromethanopterin S-methyltransferase subunit E